MCLIGLLFPFAQKPKSRGHRSSGSGHRSSGHHSSGHRSSGHRSSVHNSSGHHSSSHRSSDHGSSSKHRSSGNSSSSHKSSAHHSSSSHRSSTHRTSSHTSSSHKPSTHRPSPDHDHHRSSRPSRPSPTHSSASSSSPNRREKTEPLDSTTAAAEEALARLCLSIEASLHQEQRRWREQDRLDLLNGYHQLNPHHPPTDEEAPPYTVFDENNPPYTPYLDDKILHHTLPCSDNVLDTPYLTRNYIPDPTAAGVPPLPNSPACRPIHGEGDSIPRRSRGGSAGYEPRCCRGCVCLRCGSAIVGCGPAVMMPPELEVTDMAAGQRVVEIGGRRV